MLRLVVLLLLLANFAAIYAPANRQIYVALAVQGRADTGSSFRFWRPVAAETALFAEAESWLAQVGLADKADAVAGSLSHGEQRALELGQRRENMELQLARCAARLDLLGQALEMHAALFKLGHDLHQVMQAAPESIKPPHHEGIPGP